MTEVENIFQIVSTMLDPPLSVVYPFPIFNHLFALLARSMPLFQDHRNPPSLHLLVQ